MMLAAASATNAQPQSLSGLPVTCKGEIISRIDIDASPPFRITGSSIWKRVGRFAAKEHYTTRETVIRRYLALQLGDKCTEVRRAESERILRAQPFIADASVLAYADGQGGVILSVTTVDEVSLILSIGLGGGTAVHAVTLGKTISSAAQLTWKVVGRRARTSGTSTPVRRWIINFSDDHTNFGWRVVAESWGVTGRQRRVTHFSPTCKSFPGERPPETRTATSTSGARALIRRP